MDGIFDIEKIISSTEVDEVVKKVMDGGEFRVDEEIAARLPYTRRVSINDIVPQEYQNRLMALDIAMSKCYWEIGDIADELINSVNRQRARELGKVISKSDIYEAVGYFCHRTSRSVRYYWEVSHYFPIEVREKYDLPFNVYAEARWVQDWECLLMIAEQNPTWSAERVRSEYHKATGEKFTPKERNSSSADSRDSGSADNFRSADSQESGSADSYPLPSQGEVWTGTAPDRFRETILSKLDHTVDDLRMVLDRIKLPTSLRTRIGDVLLELQDIQLEIRREL